MGSYGWVSGRNAFSENSLQILFSAIKVPLLLSATCLISLPSFFVLNTLLGLRNDFYDALKCIVAAQATLSIILASFAPFTLLWYLSASHSRLTYQLAIAFNAFLFGLASVSSQLSLRRMYQPLVQRDRLHRVMLWGWSLVYAFVGIQMGWILRPFVGQPGGEVTFIRSDTWGNAYLKVFGLLRSLIDFG